MTETITSSSPCRICMDAKIQQVSIFSGDLSRKVSEIADVQVQEGDGLPPSICEDCEIDLERCYRFRTQIIWADSKFRERLSVSEVVFEECHIKQEGQTFINEENQEDDDDDRPPSDNDDDDYDMRDDSGDKIDEIPQEKDQPTDPIDHVEIIENRTKQELHNLPSTDGNSQDEPLIVAQMKRENEPSSDPLMQSESQQPMDTESSIPGPSTSTPTVLDFGKPDPDILNCWTVRTEDEHNNQTVKCYSNKKPARNKIVLKCMKQSNSESITDVESVKINTENRHSAVSQSYLSPQDQISIEENCLDLDVKFSLVEESTLTENVDEMNEASCGPLLQILDPGFVFDVTLTETDKTTETFQSYDSKTSLCLTEADKKDYNPHVFKTCFVCNIVFAETDQLQQHLQGATFYCRVCSKMFNNHSDLVKHFTSHDGKRCLQCKQILFCLQDIVQHYNNNVYCSKAGVKYECDLCHKLFRSDGVLYRHKVTGHPGGKVGVDCIVCNTTFASKQLLKSHLNTAHVAYEFVQCTMCDFLGLGPTDVKKHFKINHSEDVKTTAFACTVCDKVFASNANLRNHLGYHNGTETLCQVCGKGVKGGRRSWMHHMKYNHEVKTYQCKHCSELLNSLREVHRHRKLHAGDAYHTARFCDVCGKKYKNNYRLQIHLLTHSEKRGFKCEVCGASFKQENSLRTHSRIHTGILSYTCDHCDKSFRWKVTLKNHLKKCTGSAELPNDPHTS